MSSSRPHKAQKVESIWNMSGLSFGELTSAVVHGITEDDLLGRASELAFNFVLALFPLLLFILALFGLFASRSYQLQNSLLYYFSHFLPPAGFQLLKASMIETGGERHQRQAHARHRPGILVCFWRHDFHDFYSERGLSLARISFLVQDSDNRARTDARDFDSFAHLTAYRACMRTLC
jgi:hypothetical protein